MSDNALRSYHLLDGWRKTLMQIWMTQSRLRSRFRLDKLVPTNERFVYLDCSGKGFDEKASQTNEVSQSQDDD
jgi:hypothetical protein